jgi:uncharacterized damage-inducible protein DinB
VSAIDRCALSFPVLLEYTSIEHHHWHNWFAANEAAWGVAFGSPPMSTVGNLVNHIFGVELRYTQRLRDEQVSDWDELLRHESIEEAFTLGDNGRSLLVDFLSNASEDELDRILTFRTLTAGTVTASKHKVAANIFLHGIRHWGQIATALRQHGFTSQWPHDMLLAPMTL